MDASSPIPELPKESIDDVLELNKKLENIIDAVENISVQLTWMGYDMVALRTSPELGVSMRKLEEAYQKCKAIMENLNSTKQASSAAYNELENILKGLDSLSNLMDQLALRTQLRQCDLIVCVGHPDKLAFLNTQELQRQQPPA